MSNRRVCAASEEVSALVKDWRGLVEPRRLLVAFCQGGAVVGFDGVDRVLPDLDDWKTGQVVAAMLKSTQPANGVTLIGTALKRRYVHTAASVARQNPSLIVRENPADLIPRTAALAQSFWHQAHRAECAAEHFPHFASFAVAVELLQRTVGHSLPEQWRKKAKKTSVEALSGLDKLAYQSPAVAAYRTAVHNAYPHLSR